MFSVSLTYGNEGFREIGYFFSENFHKDFTLSLFNIINGRTAEILCPFEDMLDVIMLATNIEHDFPRWIAVNELSESYVVGLHFTRGRIKSPAGYRYENGKLNLTCDLAENFEK